MTGPQFYIMLIKVVIMLATVVAPLAYIIRYTMHHDTIRPGDAVKVTHGNNVITMGTVKRTTYVPQTGQRWYLVNTSWYHESRVSRIRLS